MWNGGRLYGRLGLFCELYYIMPGILKQIDNFIEIIKKVQYIMGLGLTGLILIKQNFLLEDFLQKLKIQVERK
jgi:hypothetical protein